MMKINNTITLIATLAIILTTFTFVEAAGGFGGRVGGWTAENTEPNEDVKRAVNAVAMDIMKSLNQETSYRVDSLSIVSFKTQVVAGTNFKIKMKGLLNGKERVDFFVKVFRSLPDSEGEVGHKLMKLKVLEDNNEEGGF